MKTENYPKDFLKFLADFKDEAACRQYLFEMRWPNGFVCSKCKMEEKHWLTARNTIHWAVVNYAVVK